MAIFPDLVTAVLTSYIVGQRELGVVARFSVHEVLNLWLAATADRLGATLRPPAAGPGSLWQGHRRLRTRRCARRARAFAELGHCGGVLVHFCPRL